MEVCFPNVYEWSILNGCYILFLVLICLISLKLIVFICEYISITDPFHQSDIATHIKNLNASVLSHLQHCPAFLSWIKLMFNSIESVSNIFHLLIKS